MEVSFGQFLNLPTDFDDKYLMRLIILFIAFSYLNLGHADCDRRSINSAWFALKDAAEERDVSADLDNFTNRLASCNHRIASAGEITQRNIDRYRRYGYLAEFRKRMAMIENGDSFPIDETLEWARRANQRVSRIEPRIRQLETQAREKCAPKDYRDKLPPVRDQDSMGWCFAFSAADLVSFKLGKNISASDMAMAYHYDGQLTSLLRRLGISQKASELGGGGTEAFESMIKRGVCLEKDFPSEDFRFSSGITSLRSALQSIEASARNGEKAGEPGSEVTVANIQNVYPNVDSGSIEAALQDAAKTEINRILREESCKNRIPVDLKMTEYRRKADALGVDKSSNNFIRNIISDQLNSGNILIFDNDAFFYRNPTVDARRPNHESTIVGQRWNSKKNRCDFLVRNSYGTNCSYAHSSYQCEKDGHIWIPSDIVIKATTKVRYVE